MIGKKPVKLESAMATGAVPLWMPLVQKVLERAHMRLGEGSRILEIGYGNGMLACYVTQAFGWKVTGYDIDESAWYRARYNAAAHGLLQETDFRKCKAEDVFDIKDEYDGVMIKTVLYNSKNLAEYGRWLDWILSVLKPGGLFLNWENGKGNRSVYLYRKLRGRYYADLCMYDSEIEKLYKERFKNLEIDYSGGYSWFLGSTRLFKFVSGFEDAIISRNADNSFAVGITGTRPA